jgi:dihydrofolate synthase/folylpolyglutamate synthase
MEIEREYQRSLDFIYSFIDLSITRNLRYSPDKFDLSRMYGVMSSLGDPQLNYDVVHVAGTKGKGSICAMTASIMKEAGYKVGFYSSPHMIDFRERIKINNNEISKESLTNYVMKLRQIFDNVEKISTFEIITAIAFKYFADQQVDIAFIEVGMGGRLDATNVVQPILTIISPVSHDHMKILGNTIAKIAKEKAGIIKKSIPVILSRQKKSAKEEIDIIANRNGSLIIDTTKKYAFEQINFSLEKQSFIIKEKLIHPPDTCSPIYEIPLLGDHQIHNAITAFACVMRLRKLGYEINESALKNGFSRVEWQGRFEVVYQKPLFIVDGAHNRASFRKLRDTIKKYLAGKKVTLIFGASEDKEVKLMLKIIKPYIDHFIFTKSEHPRALGLDKLEKFASSLDLNNYSISEIGSIIPRILRNDDQKIAYIASGSIFIAGAIKQLFTNQEN